MMEPPGDVLQVPLNRDKFRRYRDMQAATATIGAAMALAFCGFAAVCLYGIFADRSHAGTWGGTLFLSLCLVWFIGLASWPAFQLAKILTRTLTQNLPGLVVTREGIWDYSSNYVFGFIPWREIVSVSAATRDGRYIKNFVGIAFVVKNKDVLLKRKPGVTGMWIGMDNEITERHQVFIPQGRINVPVEDVLRQVSDFRAKLTA